MCVKFWSLTDLIFWFYIRIFWKSATSRAATATSGSSTSWCPRSLASWTSWSRSWRRSFQKAAISSGWLLFQPGELSLPWWQLPLDLEVVGSIHASLLSYEPAILICLERCTLWQIIFSWKKLFLRCQIKKIEFVNKMSKYLTWWQIEFSF